jgi:hypothetical protein
LQNILYEVKMSGYKARLYRKIMRRQDATEVREFTTINNNTKIGYDARMEIMSYISPDVNLPINFDEFLPRNAQPYSTIIPPHFTLLGGIEIQGVRDAYDQLVGQVKIDISQTLKHDKGDISCHYVEISATKINGKFDGEYYIKYITTEIDRDGYPNVDIHTEEIDYRHGIINGNHIVTDRDCAGHNVIGTTKYVNGQIVEPYFITNPPRPEPPHFLEPFILNHGPKTRENL